MNGRARNAAIGARFGRAAARYEAHAPAQRARRLAETSPGLTCRRARASWRSAAAPDC